MSRENEGAKAAIDALYEYISRLTQIDREETWPNAKAREDVIGLTPFSPSADECLDRLSLLYDKLRIHSHSFRYVDREEH